MSRDLYSKKVHVFEVFKKLLSSVKPVLEAANVPFAEGAIEIVGQIVELAETVKSNKEECETLASRCLDLISVISDAIDSGNVSEANKKLFEDSQTLTKTLESVKETMTWIKESNLFVRIIQSSDIKLRIVKRNAELDYALDRFSLSSLLEIRKSFNKMLEKVEGEISKSQVQNSADPYMLEREPPARPIIFYGRGKYVANAIKRIVSKHPVQLPILGLGGIGKTSVASAIIDDSAIRNKFSEHRYFIKCSTFLSTNEMLRAMCQIIIGSDSLTSDAKNLLGSLLKALKAAPKVLIVLDNFETVWDVEDQQDIKKVLESLFQLDCLTLLITMRGTIPPVGFRWSSIIKGEVLPALDLEDAKKTFLDICPNFDQSQQNISELSALLTKLDCVPLAVSIVAQMAYVESATPKQILANVTQYLETFRDNPNSSIKASVSLSLNSYVVRNNPDCIEVLKVIAYLPGGITTESVKSITSFKNPRRLIAALLTAGLIQRHSNRYNTLSPIRLYIEEAYPLDASTQQSIFEYYFRICAESRSAYYKSLKVRTRLSDEKANCLKILSHAVKIFKKDNSHLIAIINFSWFLYRTIPSLELLQLASKEFEACNDTSLMAKHSFISGEISRLQSNYREAKRLLSKARREFKNSGGKHDAARCLQGLGEIAYMQGKFDNATKSLSEAREELSGLGSKLEAAQCLRSLGDIARVQDKYDEAKRILSDARDEFRSIKDKLGAAQCLGSLGIIARKQKEYEGGRRILSEAKDVFVSLGERLGEAQCIEFLGSIAMDLGEFVDAKRLLLQAKGVYEVIGVPGELARCQRELTRLKRLTNESTD